MKNVLVTGGAGFIGSHVVDALLANNFAVRVVDNLSTGKIENINPNAEFMWGDICNNISLKKAFEGMDYCVHLAAIASVKKSIDNWAESSKTNAIGTANVFEISAALGIDKVIFASSAAVYGTPENIPLSEDSKISPLSPYGADKYLNELYAKAAFQCFKSNSIGLRFFNVYGPRQDPFSPYSGVISQFINGIEKNTTLKVFGNGNQTRDFICVTDVAGIIVDAIKNKIVSGAEIYNVCTGTETSINELIGILYEICKQTKNVEYYPQREGDILKSCGFNGRLIRDFGERKFIDLKSGLIPFFK